MVSHNASHALPLTNKSLHHPGQGEASARLPVPLHGVA